MKKIKKLFAVTFMGAAVVVTGGCGTGEGVPQMGLPEAGFITVKPERQMLITELPGRTAVYRIAEIRPQVNGIILKREFDEGSDVKAGDLLYQIDTAPYQAAYDQAKAAVAMAEASLPALRSREKRFKDLVESHAVGQQDYDDALSGLQKAEAQLASAQALLKSAEINLSYTSIKAPISGRIGRSHVTEGALVTAYQPVPLAVIQQLDPVYVDVPQSTSELLELRKRLVAGNLNQDGEDQNKVQIIQQDGKPYALDGTLEFRDVTVDPSTGSVILRIIVPNPDNALLPGMFVRAVLKEGVNDNAVLIPQQGLLRNQRGEPYALVINADDKVEQKMLTIDRAVGNRWLVSSGLAAGDRVIVEGILKMRPGSPVKAVPVEPGGQETTEAVNKDLPAEKSI